MHADSRVPTTLFCVRATHVVLSVARETVSVLQIRLSSPDTSQFPGQAYGVARITS